MIIHGIILLVGTTGLYFALVQYQKTRLLLSSGIVTTATVVEMIEGQGEDGDLSMPKFRFIDNQNRPVEFTSGISSKPPAWEVGEQVHIIYPPQQANEAKVISYWNLFRWSIILAALASPFLIIGLGYFIFQFYVGDLNPRI